jgi:hypothetical protein
MTRDEDLPVRSIFSNEPSVFHGYIAGTEVYAVRSASECDIAAGIQQKPGFCTLDCCSGVAREEFQWVPGKVLLP